MKNSPNFLVKWPLLAVALLCAGAHHARAQERLDTPGKKTPTTSKPILGGHSRELLKRYGKPTAICVFPGFLANKSELPAGVPQLSSAPQWAQSVSFSTQGRNGAMVWLYKRNDKAVSYLLDPLGYVEAACVATSEKPTTAKPPEFEVSTLPTVVLGEDAKNVLGRYGYPDEVRSIAPQSTELVYLAKTPPKGYDDAFATVFTLRDNQVVRVYSHSYMPLKSGQSPLDRLPSDPSKNGRYFLLNPS